MNPSPVLALAESEDSTLGSIANSGGEIFLEHRDSLTLRLEAGAVDAKGDRDVGAGIRFVGDGAPAYVSTNAINSAALMEAARVAAWSARATFGSSPGTALAVRQAESAHHPQRPADSLDYSAKASILQRIDDAAREVDPRIRRVSVTYVEVVQHVLVMSGRRPPVHDVRTRTRVTCRVVARDGDSQGSGFDGPGVGGGFELFDEHSPESIGATAARRALQNLTGVEHKSRTCQVVLGPSAGGMLVHEACGHGLEADLLARESSVFAQTRGARLAEAKVTIVDDPSLSAGFGSYGVDDEGEPARRRVLIDAGIQVAELTDAAAAAKLRVVRSSNGRRESYAHPPIPRMSNTYFDVGTESASTIIGDVADGVYVARLSAGEVDTATGDFTFSASEAREIIGGQLGRWLRGVTLIGNCLEALAAIDAVAGDLAFTQAMCGKEDQWVPVSYGSPTMRVGALTVTGR